MSLHLDPNTVLCLGVIGPEYGHAQYDQKTQNNPACCHPLSPNPMFPAGFARSRSAATYQSEQPMHQKYA
jgi:hypothetical protein